MWTRFAARICLGLATLTISHLGLSYPILVPYVSDADAVDLESSDRELYSDEFSYRHSLYWDERFAQSQAAYRTSSGSLDINRSFINEEYKLRAATETNAAAISFYSYKHESLVEQYQYRELRLTGRLIGPIYGSFFGYTGLVKKFADLGYALSYRSKLLELEAYYVSVDHYYNAKEDLPEDTYKRKPWTAGFSAKIELAEHYRLRLHSYYNRPYRWYRPSEMFVYEHARGLGSGELRFLRQGSHQPVVTVDFDRKEERRDLLGAVADDTAQQKELRRKVWRGQLAYQPRELAGDYWAAGIWGLYRDARYLSYSAARDEAKQHSWREYAAWYERQTILSPSHLIQYGGQSSAVAVQSFNQTTALWYAEAKATFSYEYRFAKAGALRLVGTADLDQLVARFPYQDGFPGWDGGAFQLHFSF